MRFSTLRRLVLGMALLATAAALVGWALTVDAVRSALPQGALLPLASAVLAVPYLIHFAFAFIQSLPGGRRIVPLRVTRSADAWCLILVITTLLPKTQLAAWATPVLASAESGVPLSLVLATMAIAARVIQLNVGARLGVTAETDGAPR
jgi:hypothetical protein